MPIIPPKQNQRIHAPFRYFGSKSRRLGFVLPFLPERPGARVYPFGGGGSIELNAPFNAIEVYNDLNGDAVNLFKIVANPQKLSQLLDLIFATPYSRAEFHRAFAVTHDPLEQARRFLIRQQQSFGGLGRSFGVQVDRQGRNSSNMTRWADLGDVLKIVHQRVRHWIFECQDFQKILEFYDRPSTAFYCDPPYIPATRSGGRQLPVQSRNEVTAWDAAAISFRCQLIGISRVSSRHNWQIYKLVRCKRESLQAVPARRQQAAHPTG